MFSITVVYVIVAVVMLGVLVFLHELGHYMVGRRMGIGVVEFAIGMGPKLFGWERNGTQYSIRCIPVGGFCAFVGEDDGSDKPNAMNAQPAWKRFLTVAAGPVMNLLVAFVITVIMIASGKIYNMYETECLPYVVSVVEGMPADEAGLQVEDIITEVNGEEVTFDGKGMQLIYDAIDSGEAMALTVERGEETLYVTLTPEYSESAGKLLMGVSFPTYYAQYDCNILTAIPETLKFMGRTVVATIEMLGDLISNLLHGAEIEQGTVSGVVGVVSTVSSDLSASFSDAFSSGMFVIFYYLMAISLSLGIMNLLPLPALDGGRLVFLMVEMITGKHLKREAEGVINLIGLVLLLVLMVVITFSDVRALFE